MNSLKTNIESSWQALGIIEKFGERSALGTLAVSSLGALAVLDGSFRISALIANRVLDSAATSITITRSILDRQ